MIKVLFVSSGNSLEGISPIIKNQGESLREKVELNYFTIKGKGLKGYLSAISKLRKHLKETDYDIVHAHYSFSAFVASLAGTKPLVVSLMGSDVVSKGFYKFIIKYFYSFFWSKVIVKSNAMRNSLGLKEIYVIPNGVDFNKFKPFDKVIGLKETGWNILKKHVLFAANPFRPEKNYKIAKEAFDLLENQQLELHFLENVSNESMPYYYNAADVVLLTSMREGSPNVIKEAMACNTPIVSTDVGDVKEVIGETKGCYIATMTSQDVADKIKEAILFGSKTKGREAIKYLSENIIAENIINIYINILNLKN